jgi:hypothetical protein
MYPSLEQMTQDIINGANARGINPDYALRVTRAEGLQPGVWQSNYRYKSGAREKSYGPWQLNVDSPNALGSAFRRDTGLDPSDPANWKAANDYALDAVKKRGWGDWYGAKKEGITGMMGVGNNASAPMMLGLPSEQEKPMTVNQPSFPALDPNNLIDPKNLTPLQLAMLQAQGGGLMGPGSTPGLGSPDVQALAAGQGDPSMFDPMAVPNNAPMNPNQSVPGGGTNVPPLQAAMQLGPDGPMDMAQDGPGGPTPPEEPFWKTRDYWKRALLGAGAGLSSIDNPQGGAVALGLLKQMDDKGNKYSTQQLWDGTVLKIDRNSGDVSVVRKGSDALGKKKEGLPDANTAKANYLSISQNIDRMTDNMDALINAPEKDLGWITGTSESLLWTAPAGLGISEGVAPKLQAKYDTLLAQGTLDEVRKLKEQSATLGQISNYEDMLFQKAFAPLSNKLAPADFAAELRKKREAVGEIKKIMRQKYISIYGAEPDDAPSPSSPPPGETGGFKILGVE